MARRLEELVGAARALPGVKAAVRPLGVEPPGPPSGVDPAALRRRLAAFLAALAARLEPALLAAL